MRILFFAMLRNLITDHGKKGNLELKVHAILYCAAPESSMRETLFI